MPNDPDIFFFLSRRQDTMLFLSEKAAFLKVQFKQKTLLTPVLFF